MYCELSSFYAILVIEKIGNGDHMKNKISEKSEKTNHIFKHQVLITSLCVLVVVCIVFSTSFAIFSKTHTGDEYNVVQVGNLELSYVDSKDEGNVLELASGYPVLDEVASSSLPYRFSVDNKGKHVTKYTVKIIQDMDTIKADGCENKLVDPSYLRYKFDNQEAKVFDPISNDEDGYVIYTGTLQPLESNIHEVRLWIDEQSSHDVVGKHYHGKVVIEMSSEGEDVDSH